MGAIAIPKPNIPTIDWDKIKLGLLGLIIMLATISSNFFDVAVRDYGGTTYYVDDISSQCTPSVTGSGTLADPWTNLFYAATRGNLQPGDTLQLREGLYYINAPNFPNTGTEAERFDNCVGYNSSSGVKTVLPLTRDYIQGTAASPIIIENYPGEVAHITGGNHNLYEGGWQQCINAPTVWYIDHNDGSVPNPQIWYDYDFSDPDNPQFATRVRKVAATWTGGGTCPTELDIDPSNEGAFAQYDGGSVDEIVVHMVNDQDPNSTNWILGCEGGTCAPLTIATMTDYVTVRKNPAGGAMVITGGRYSVMVDDDAPQADQGTLASRSTNLIFDGLVIGNTGSSDYGIGWINRQGSFNKLMNSEVGFTIAEGAGPYGGDTSITKGGSNVDNIVVENTYIHDTGRGWLPDGSGSGTSLGHGIISRNCTNCRFSDNLLDNGFRNGISHSNAFAGPCVSDPGGCHGDNTIIERNEVHNYGFFRTGGIGGATQCSTDSAAIYVTQNSNVTSGSMNGTIIRNNMIYRQCSISGAVAGIKISDGGPSVTIPILDTVVAYNSFSSDFGGANISLDENDVGQSTAAVIGNSMYYNGSHSGCNGQACAFFTAADPQPFTADNNYYAPNAGDQVIKTGSGNYTRNSVSGYEATGTNDVPGYLDGVFDLHVRSDSALVNTADCTRAEAPSDDFDKKARPATNCTRGADEVN